MLTVGAESSGLDYAEHAGSRWALLLSAVPVNKGKGANATLGPGHDVQGTEPAILGAAELCCQVEQTI